MRRIAAGNVEHPPDRPFQMAAPYAFQEIDFARNLNRLLHVNTPEDLGKLVDAAGHRNTNYGTGVLFVLPPRRAAGLDLFLVRRGTGVGRIIVVALGAATSSTGSECARWKFQFAR